MSQEGSRAWSSLGRELCLPWPMNPIQGILSVRLSPGTCWVLSCPGSSVSLREGLAARTANKCSLPSVLPSLPAPELCEAAGSFPASLGSVSQDPDCVWLSPAVGCSLCGMAARAWVSLAPLHLFQTKVWAGISLPGKRSSFCRVSGRAFPTFRAPLSPLALSVQQRAEPGRLLSSGVRVQPRDMGSLVLVCPHSLQPPDQEGVAR